MALTNAAPGVVTVYDLHSFRGLTTARLTKRLYARLMMRYAVRSASMLLPMSRATERELAEILDVGAVPMVVIPPAIDDRFRVCDQGEVHAFTIRHGLPTMFWVYVAHFLGYKNHLRLINAYVALRSQGHGCWPLVLRGDPSDTVVAAAVAAKVQALGLGNEVLFLPALNPNELPLLYSAASALVFPSLYEGGGLPVLEAMACGCPVLASRIPPVVEFADFAGTYFDPLDTKSIMQGMLDFQNSASLRKDSR